MNTQKSIAVFAAIAAIAMTTIGLTSESTTLMVAPQESNGIDMLGHIEFTVRDSNEQIIKYVQGDNSVVDAGKDCVAEYMFGVDDTDNCILAGTLAFNNIAIGNGTQGGVIPTRSDLLQLTNSSNVGCATAGAYGEINRFGGTSVDGVTISTTTSADNSTGPFGTVVELNTGTAFAFDSSNATVVTQSGIFSGTGYNADQCSGTDVASATGVLTGDMFAIQELNTANGITVTDGDSLSVKWTITIGG